jgi:hypothetical protein
MTNPPPLLFASEPNPPRRRINGWELALWIAGVVLLASACVFEVTFIAVIVRESNPETISNNIGPYEAFYQSAEILVPGVVTGGFLCLALAIAVRALDVNARRRGASLSAPVAMAPSVPVEAHDAPVAANTAPIPAPATQAESTAPTDYAVFMRPSENPADRAP